jgi:redox-sensitive bicupin YhaK (pirin superfamily)
VKLRIIAGEAFGKTSPVKTFSPIFYVEARMEAGANLEIPQNYSERAIYLIEGDVSLNNEKIEPQTMLVLNSGVKNLIAKSSAHFMILGGEPLSEPRHIYWNFVSSSLAKIEEAKRDWQEGRFAKIPGDETEFMPLPEEP